MPIVIVLGSVDMLTMVIAGGWEAAVLIINAVMHSMDVPTIVVFGSVDSGPIARQIFMRVGVRDRGCPARGQQRAT